MIRNLKKNDIYGVLPFVAPEVLRRIPYTLASDIYSFSMIMWEFTSGVPPFDNRAHDLQLSISICKDERPEIIKNTPQCYVDLMKKCWDKDPLKRPNASEIERNIYDWIAIIADKENTDKESNIIMEFYKADTNILNNSNIICNNILQYENIIKNSCYIFNSECVYTIYDAQQ